MLNSVEKNISPNMKYAFIQEIFSKYENLKMNFNNGDEEITDKAWWWGDMKFLFHLTRVFRFFDANDRFPKVEFQKLSDLINAMWNSRAILTLLAFILLPMKRNSLLCICKFTSFEWTDLWFSDQGHHKALNTVKKFWKPERSKLRIPRSNQCAERAIKCLQDLFDVCKKKENLQLRFILSNKA